MSAPSLLGRDLLRIASLLGSGALGALVLAALIAGAVPIVPFDVAVDVSLYLTLYALFQTVAKLGVDGYLFAGGDAPGAGPRGLRRWFVAWVVPVALLGAAACGARYGPLVAIPTFVALCLDTRSVVLAAMIGGRGDTRPMSIGTLLNLPLFFVLFVGASFASAASIAVAAWAFVGSSLARYAYLSSKAALPDGPSQLAAATLLTLGVQQVLNYVMFRVDQILIGAAHGTVLRAEAQDVAAYLVRSKGLEVACMVATLVCMVAFPRTARPAPIRGGAAGLSFAPPPASPFALLLLLGSTALVVSAMLGSDFGSLAPFAVAGALALPVNHRTFEALREERFGRLLAGLAGALLAGALHLGSRPWPVPLDALAWTVPVQLVVFLLLTGRR